MDQPAQRAPTKADGEPGCLSAQPGAPGLMEIAPDSIRPGWIEWERALSVVHASSARAHMGLDPDRAIVMSGHQPIVFHPGILAKLIALDEASRRTGARAVWIVPDQDAVDPTRLRVPAGLGRDLGVRIVELLPGGSIAPGVPLASIPARRMVPSEITALGPLVEALNAHADSASLAEQFALAVLGIACDLLSIERPKLIFASRLLRASGLSGVVEKMRRDPARCARAYNDAALAHPEAGVRSLSIGRDRVELPLWGLRPGRARIAIDSKNIGSFTPDELAPRALLMSALARAELADLFIHGSGGWAYDRISEDWFADWLGRDLRPMGVVTATLRLDLGLDESELIDPARAAWEAHHAAHTPEMLGDGETQGRKDRLVEEIARAKAEGRDAGRLFGELTALLAAHREAHEPALKDLRRRARRARLMGGQRQIAKDRTWPFVLYPPGELLALDRAVRRAMG